MGAEYEPSPWVQQRAAEQRARQFGSMGGTVSADLLQELATKHGVTRAYVAEMARAGRLMELIQRGPGDGGGRSMPGGGGDLHSYYVRMHAELALRKARMSGIERARLEMLQRERRAYR